MTAAYAEGFASLYDSLMDDVDYGAWAAYLMGLIRARLPDTKAPFLLDAACGTGAMSVRFAELGCRVVGSDVSPAMLALAQQRARAHGVAVPFVEQDMRALAAHKKADVVTACCDGVNYLLSLADVSKFFRAAKRALRPGGLLLFDVSSAYKLARVLDGETFGEARENAAYLWQNVFDPDTRLLEMNLSFFVREGALYRRFDETHVQRAHTREELDALLLQEGFTALACYDAFTGNPPRADSERMQWIATSSHSITTN